MALDADGRTPARRRGHGWAPAWSPDGRTIAFTDNISPSLQTLFVMNADGSGRHRLPLPAGGERRASNYLPAWSPDGSRFAFTRSVSNARSPSGRRVDVYLVDVNARNVRRLTTSGVAYAPTWSPDGRRIAYLEVLGTSDARRLHVVNADGTGDRTLAAASRASGARADTPSSGHPRGRPRPPDRVLSRDRPACDRIRDPHDQPTEPACDD